MFFFFTLWSLEICETSYELSAVKIIQSVKNSNFLQLNIKFYLPFLINSEDSFGKWGGNVKNLVLTFLILHFQVSSNNFTLGHLSCMKFHVAMKVFCYTAWIVCKYLHLRKCPLSGRLRRYWLLDIFLVAMVKL